MMQQAALEEEARQRGFATVADLMSALDIEVRTQVQDADVSDDEILAIYDEQPLYRYAPPHTLVVQLDLPTAEDAARVGARAKTAAALREAASRYPGTTAWDITLQRRIEGKEGTAIVQGRTVFFIVRQMPETNSFTQVKEKLRSFAYEDKVKRVLQARLQSISEKHVILNEQALKQLQLSTKH